MIIVVQVATVVLQSIVLLMLIYILLLTGLAWIGRRRSSPSYLPATNFAIIVPAHNEERVISLTLQNLKSLAYPSHLYDVHLVADNCTDDTPEIARLSGAIVHERFDPDHRGKGYALRWALSRLNGKYDAFVILDADSVVSADFLNVMDGRLQEGELVIQGRDDVLNVAESWPSSLRFVAMSLYNHVRSLGERTAKLSCGLKGNGMCFAASVLTKHGWSSYSLVEDLDFHNRLLQLGLRVSYAPDARVWAQMPARLKESRPQNVRWESGRLEVAFQQAPRLLWQGLRARKPTLVMAAVDELVPPLSVLVAVSAVNLGIALLFGPPVTVMLSGISLGALFIHVVAGLIIAEAPWRAYLSLVYAPGYVIWKVALYLTLLLGKRQTEWVRTPRSKVTR